MEFYTGTQFERDGQPVVAGGVPGRQPGYELRRIILIDVQRIVDVDHVTLHGHIGKRVRIETAGKAVGPDQFVRPVLSLRDGNTHDRCGQGRTGTHQECSTFHQSPPFSTITPRAAITRCRLYRAETAKLRENGKD